MDGRTRVELCADASYDSFDDSPMARGVATQSLALVHNPLSIFSIENPSSRKERKTSWPELRLLLFDEVGLNASGGAKRDADVTS